MKRAKKHLSSLPHKVVEMIKCRLSARKMSRALGHRLWDSEMEIRLQVFIQEVLESTSREEKGREAEMGRGRSWVVTQSRCYPQSILLGALKPWLLRVAPSWHEETVPLSSYFEPLYSGSPRKEFFLRGNSLEADDSLGFSSWRNQSSLHKGDVGGTHVNVHHIHLLLLLVYFVEYARCGLPLLGLELYFHGLQWCNTLSTHLPSAGSWTLAQIRAQAPFVPIKGSQTLWILCVALSKFTQHLFNYKTRIFFPN